MAENLDTVIALTKRVAELEATLIELIGVVGQMQQNADTSTAALLKIAERTGVGNGHG